MPRPCEVCGNTYDRPLTVRLDGRSHVFDCFECAVHALAPICEHCGCRVIGHGVQDDGANPRPTHRPTPLQRTMPRASRRVAPR